MGVAERREQEKMWRRKRAIKAAMEIYNEEGYHALTMEKIAERSEISRAALYIYFKNMDEIFISAIVNHVEYFVNLLQGVYDQREELKGRLLEKLWKCFQKFYERDAVAFNASLYFHQNEMVRNLPEDLREKLAQVGSKATRLQHKIVQYGVNEGLFVKCNPRTLSEVIWTSFLGISELERSKHVMRRKSHLDITRGLALEVLSRGTLRASPNDF
jgi:TetR/AcrR family transcriptional regulator